MDGRNRDYSGFAIVVGVIIVPRFFRWPYNLASLLARELERWSLISGQSIFPVSNLISFLTAGVLLVLVVGCWERKNIKELGLSAPWFRSVLIAIGAWILFLLSSPILLSWGRLVGTLVTTNQVSQLPPFDLQMWRLTAPWFYTIIAADVIFEELVTRAYVIERLTGFMGSIWMAGAMSFLLSLSLHLPARNLYEALLRAPLIVLLVATYMYSRSLIACVVFHFLVDANLMRL